MPEDFDEKDKKKWSTDGFRQYGIYSTVVFQMLATMGLGFWGGRKLNDYFGIEKNWLTIVIGLLAMALAFYNLLNQLKNIQKNDKR